VINEQRRNFNSVLPSEIIEYRKTKFESKFGNFNNMLHYYGISANFGICNNYCTDCVYILIISY